MIKEKVRQVVEKVTAVVKKPVTKTHRLFLQANGGWGRLVYDALRQMLEGDPLAEIVKALIIDTDASGLEQYAAEETYVVDRVPMRKLLSRMMKDIKALPQFRALFGDYIQKLWQILGSSEDVPLGAMMCRLMGLGALKFHLERRPEILAALVAPVRALNRFSTKGLLASPNGRGNDQRAKQNILPTLICQVQSLVGGHGSSTEQAIADVLRDLLHQQGIRHRMVSIEALPGVFWNLDHHDQTKVLAHGYTKLRESMHRQLNPLSSWDAGLAGMVERDGTGHEIIYLLDGSNRNGQVMDGPEAVAAVAAKFIHMTMLGGPIAKRYEANLRNKFHCLQPPYSFSSFDVLEITLDIDQMIKAFGFRSAWRVIDQQLLRRLSESELKKLVQQQVQVFVTQSGIQDTSHWFQTTQAGEPIRLSVQSLKGKPLDEVLRRADQRELKKLPGWQQEMPQAVDLLVTQVFDRIVNQVVGLINTKGIRQALVVLQQGIAPELVQYQQMSEKRLVGNRRKLAEHQRQVAQQRQQPVWKKLTLHPRQRNLTQIQTDWDLKLAQMRGQVTVQVYSRLEEQVNALISLLESWITALETRVERLQAMEQAYAQERQAKPEFIVEVWSEEDQQGLFKKYDDKVLQLMGEAMQFVWADNELILELADVLTGEPELEHGLLPALSEASMRRYVLFATRFWQFLKSEKGLSVEQILEQQGRDPQALVDQIFDEYAVPLINIDDLDQDKPLVSILVMGSQHGTEGFFKGVSKPYLTIEKTGDRFTIQCLATVHGISVQGLAQYRAMKAAHDQLDAAGEPLYVDPEAKEVDLEDISDEQPSADSQPVCKASRMAQA